MGELSWWHWLIVVLVFVLLFGSKRLPDAARSLGRSMRIFKSEMKSMHDEDEPAATSPTTTPPASELPTAAPTATTTPEPTPDTPAVGEHTDVR